MKLQLSKSLDTRGVTYWNELSAMERLDFVLRYQGLFLNSRLVNPGEFLAVRTTPEYARKFIVAREESPFFSAIDIKKRAEAQKAVLPLVTTINIALSL